MHVEPPGHAPQSLKEFGKHYLMIVLGILTAVGIEQGLEAIHHHHLAEQATRQIEEELQSNLAQARETQAQNRQRLTEVKATVEALVQDVHKKDESLATFALRLDSIHVGTATPMLRRDAWEAAIASQALSYVAPAKVRRFSEGYSAQRDTMQTILMTFSLGNWPGQIQNAAMQAKLGRVDQVGLLNALASYELALAAIAGNERELEQAFSAAVKADAGGDAHR